MPILRDCRQDVLRRAQSPPHFHAEYGDDEALIDIRTCAVFAGRLPPRALGLVIEWTSQHQQELLDLWQNAQSQKALHRLEPLP